MSGHCVFCGKPAEACSGTCRRPLDPPRFCPECGKKLIAQVTPTGYSGRCKTHGTFDIERLSGA